jgi:hypothetical protein
MGIVHAGNQVCKRVVRLEPIKNWYGFPPVVPSPSGGTFIHGLGRGQLLSPLPLGGTFIHGLGRGATTVPSPKGGGDSKTAIKIHTHV